MKSKVLICAVLLLGFVGLTGASYLANEHSTYKVADRMAT